MSIHPIFGGHWGNVTVATPIFVLVIPQGDVHWFFLCHTFLCLLLNHCYVSFVLLLLLLYWCCWWLLSSSAFYTDSGT